MARYDGLEGAAVLLTGAARGLGAALARSFAAQGSRLVLVDVDAAGLATLVSHLELPEGRLVSVEADLSQAEQLPDIVESAVRAFGRLDVLVNNAALIDGVTLDDLTVDLFDRVIAINLRAPLFLSRAAIPIMREQGGGRIVNVGSMAARSGGAYPTVFSYAASKGGLLSITRSLARVGAADNILVNAILPSNIDSPMLWGPFRPESVRQVIDSVPLKRPARPEEVAELVLWLASSASSYVTGASWDVNGGWFMS